MKKVLLGLFAILSISAIAADNGVNVYGRFGLDVISRYNKIKNDDTGETLVKGKGKVAPGIFLEVTKDINKNAEVGFGLGYIWHGKRDFNGEDVDYSISGKLPAVNSVPLYVTGKYKFDINSNAKPYIKADLGYSFNNMKKSFDLDVTEKATGNTVTMKEDGYKLKNGVYVAVGVGVEYMDFTTDLSYVFTGAKIKYDDGDKDKANNSAIRLTVGYKFSF